MNYAIELTDKEAALLAQIELDKPRISHEQYKARGPLVLEFFDSLVARNAIPKARMRYWNDPEYQTGHSKVSHKGVFEKNGCNGNEIYTHPNFREYLKYFLFGAELPQAVIAQFEELVGNPEWITSGDLAGITKGTRQLVRQYCLKSEAEEFFRLALDVGLDVFFAKSVRDAVKQVK